MLPSGPVTSVLFLDGTALRLGPWLPDSMLIRREVLAGHPAAAPGRAGVVPDPHRQPLDRLVRGRPDPPSRPPTRGGPTPPPASSGSRSPARCPCRGMLDAHQGRWWRAGAWGVLGAALLVRTPLMYPPWALVVVPVVLLGTAPPCWRAPAQADRRRDRRWRPLTMVFLAASTGRTGRRSRRPADRLSRDPGGHGRGRLHPALFGATNLDILADGVGGRRVQLVGDLVRLHRGLLVAPPAALAAGVVGASRASAGRVVTVLCRRWAAGAWSTVDFGALGTGFPWSTCAGAARRPDPGPPRRDPPCLVLPAARSARRWPWPSLPAGRRPRGGYAGSFLRLQNLPDCQSRRIWLAAIGRGAWSSSLVTYRPRSPWATSSVGRSRSRWCGTSTPCCSALGDLRGRGVSQAMLLRGGSPRRAAPLGLGRLRGGLADDGHRRACPVGSPDVRDPSRGVGEARPQAGHEDVWNRGGSYIWFAWTGRSSCHRQPQPGHHPRSPGPRASGRAELRLEARIVSTQRAGLEAA